MASGTLFGLVLIGAGIFLFAVSQFLTDHAAKIRVEWFQPDLNRPAFKRRNVRILRFTAAALVVIGLGIAVYGLVSGR
ncbi:MAG TPA: hypothetical protein VLT34_09420 [Arthrobacter sp.]|nr:hypothetical protein [Arthrobacter sp.]